MPDLTPSLNYDIYGPPMDEKSPISIKVDPSKPPGTRFTDFKPSQRKLDEMEAYRRGVPEEEVRGPHRVGVIVEPNATYISNADMKKRLDQRRGQIVKIAKKIFSEHKTRRLEFLAAEKVFKNMTAHERKNPSNKLHIRSLKILDRGHPMTKEKAIEIAKQRVYEEMRPRT